MQQVMVLSECMALKYVFCLAACRYEKGTWSTCSAQNEMVRTDTLKDKSDSTCEQTRQITKKCKSKGQRPAKGGARRNRQ
ncbi:hypothetical protein J6590_006432 [Homalodisca vitripennis]|nr:hypothetical protein J6590_006432 [Homalodisca vitripennis]